jgi:hypothetical protein
MSRMMWSGWALASGLVVLGCGIAGPEASDDDDEAGGPSGVGAGVPGPSSGQGADDSSGPAGPGSGSGAAHGTGGSGAGTTGAGAGSTTGSGAGGTTGSGGSTSTGSGGSGGNGPNGCYTEGWDPNPSLSDLEASYSQGQWLGTMLETLARRYHNGHYLMSQMQNDPWLTNSFPSYFDLSNWGGMVESIDTACHEESHGYDFDAALSTPGDHVYFMGSNLEVQAAKLNFFARNQILQLVQQGGSVTGNYDSTYLTGTQGSYDFIFLADELTAYINGLACAVAVGAELSQTGFGYSYRDGAASHLYYLETYLKVARTQYANLYNQWKGDPDWQEFVRFSWARGHFWTAESAQYPKLGINDAAIWQRVNDPANLQEIQMFTNEDPGSVACNP